MAFIFNKKKSAPADDSQAEKEGETAALNQDLIVHNMPSASRLSGASPEITKEIAPKISSSISMPGSSGKAAGTGNNSKIIGLVIMGGGVIFIALLVYLSYRFVIRPTAGPSIPQTSSSAKQLENTATSTASTTAPDLNTSSNTITVATTSNLTAASTTILDLAAASSTSESMASIDQTLINDTSNLPPIVDTDNDGLNDEEETAFGTSATSTDSNLNNYPDLTEINNNYNPAGTGRLNTSNHFAVYDNKVYNYQIIYPKDWPVKTLNSDGTIVFTTPDDSLIQISTEDNPDKATILSWYEGAFPNSTATYDKMKSTASWDGIMGDDGFNFYLTDKKHENIFVISYIPSASNRIVYPNIFRAMINSFIIK